MWTVDDNGTDSFIDCRDIYNRVDELESIRDDFEEWESDAPEPGSPDSDFEAWRDDVPEQWTAELAAELDKILDAFGGYGGVPIDGSLIHESAFDDYARGLFRDCHDCGDVPDRFINFDAWADELRHDYSIIELDGETFYSLDV